MIRKSKYPIKKLRRLNVWLAIYFVLLWLGIFMATQGFQNLVHAVRNSILGTVLLLANSFLNLAILVYFEDRLRDNKTKDRIVFLTTSYSLNLVLYLCIAFLFAQIIRADIQIIKFVYVGFLSILINTSSLVVQGFMILQDSKTKIELENSKLKAANSEAANQLLRQQIQPHFLFNALSTLQSLYKKDTTSGETYLMHLSDFLRAVVSTNNTKLIPLKEEITLCRDYFEMQRIRFSEALQISFSIQDEIIEKGFIPSFALQTLLENAIKHNQLTEETPLCIQVNQHGDSIEVSNNLNLKSSSNVPSTGSGLMNLSERYRLISGDEIRIDQTEKTFSVRIKIIK